jgi:hypothetical protein
VRNHDEKITDVIRSVLPSTARRDARRTRQLIHRAARRKVHVAFRAGDIDSFVDILHAHPAARDWKALEEPLEVGPDMQRAGACAPALMRRFPR